MVGLSEDCMRMCGKSGKHSVRDCEVCSRSEARAAAGGILTPYSGDLPCKVTPAAQRIPCQLQAETTCVPNRRITEPQPRSCLSSRRHRADQCLPCPSQNQHVFDGLVALAALSLHRQDANQVKLTCTSGTLGPS